MRRGGIATSFRHHGITAGQLSKSMDDLPRIANCTRRETVKRLTDGVTQAIVPYRKEPLGEERLFFAGFPSPV